MNILVTGGCGFIGSNFVRLALEKLPDSTIVNLDALTYAGNPENLADVEDADNYRFVKGSICDKPLVLDTLKKYGIDAIINFAAESHVDRSILDSSPFIDTNVVGTQVLLDAARQMQVERYIQISTDEVYGALALDSDERFTSGTPLRPNSPYAASKAAADLLVRSYYHTFQFPAAITRCSNNYGPYQFPEKLIPLMICNAMNNEKLPVYGDGRYVRDWIHVRDHCDAVLQILLNFKPGGIFNIGAENEQSNLDVIRMILNLLDRSEDLIEFVKDRPGHDRRYAICNEEIRRELKWEPSIDFEQGMQETVAWYRENQEWIDRIRSGAYMDYYQQQYGNR